MYINEIINSIKPPVTLSGFPAITITLPELQKAPQTDLFSLPVLKQLETEKDTIPAEDDKEESR